MMGRFQSIDDVWEYLNSIPMFSKVGSKASNFGLENISRFCELIGRPHTKFKSIHVAGTNGKGTTCYLLEAVYKQAGYKTGMFISPHLLRYNERIRVSGEEVSDQRILDFFRSVESALEDIPLTYFEISTALAFWIFAEEKVDIAIIETGLGGRLDSTNIIQPELSIITSIGKDHEQILGDTIEKIALEKAGIIKTNTSVVVGNLDESSFQVIESEARKKGSHLVKSSDLAPTFDKGRITFPDDNLVFKTSFVEPINAWNVTIAYQAFSGLQNRFPVSKDAFKEAMETFTGVPARFEKLHPERKWYFSGSHNEQAIDAMLEAVELLSYPKKVLVLSLMKDKAKPEVLSKFKGFDALYFYQQEGERAATHSEVAEHLSIKKIDEDSCKMILNELKTELVIFAGSFYFYSTIKRWLMNGTEIS